jgi:site-specific recombinase XerD
LAPVLARLARRLSARAAVSPAAVELAHRYVGGDYHIVGNGTLPQILSPGEVDRLVALRTRRDRAMVEAMLFAGLRRSEVLGLRLGDVRSGERRLFVADGKGGHQRLVPVSIRFFATLADYLNYERPAGVTTDRVFVVLKGPTRGEPLSTKGMEQVMRDARRRAGLGHGTCHELRHTCFTRLREAGMALEAIQAQAGHRSIRSPRSICISVA